MASDNQFYIEIRKGEFEDQILKIINRYGTLIEPFFHEMFSCCVIEIVQVESIQMARIFWGGDRTILNELRLRLINDENRLVAAKTGNDYKLWSRDNLKRLHSGSITSLKRKNTIEKMGYVAL